MLSPSITIAQFTIIESLRNRLIWLCVVILSLALLLAHFIGEISITDHASMQVAILAFILRTSAVVIIGLFVISCGVRELGDKTLEMILTKPLPRHVYFAGKFSGYLFLAFFLSLLFSSVLFFYASSEQVLIWLLSLLLELSIVVAFSLVVLFTFHQLTTAFAALLIFYLSSRFFSAMVLMTEHPLFQSTELAQQFTNKFIVIISWLLPDLSRFTQTNWLTYSSGQWAMLSPIFVESMIYIALLSTVSIFDLYRKNI